MHSGYILYSLSLDKYYIGETENISLRLDRHNQHFFKGAYTTKDNNWVLKWSTEVLNREIARKIELFLKKQKSKQFIMKFLNSKEIQDSIMTRFEKS